jgi:uncharacterized protein YxjI
MHPSINKNLFFVKEHVKIFKAANSFDIIDPDSKQVVLQCREEGLGFFTKMFRFTDYKRMTPFNMEIKTPEGQKILTVRRGISIFLSNVEVVDASERPLCMLKGKWTSWDFKFISNDGKEFATVTKKWSGLGKELFTSADNYILQISSEVPADHPLRMLILSAVMCIDLVLKE